jgi:hypothetical protein
MLPGALGMVGPDSTCLLAKTAASRKTPTSASWSRTITVVPLASRDGCLQRNTGKTHGIHFAPESLWK